MKTRTKQRAGIKAGVAQGLKKPGWLNRKQRKLIARGAQAFAIKGADPLSNGDGKERPVKDFAKLFEHTDPLLAQELEWRNCL